MSISSKSKQQQNVFELLGRAIRRHDLYPRSNWNRIHIHIFRNKNKTPRFFTFSFVPSYIGYCVNLSSEGVGGTDSIHLFQKLLSQPKLRIFRGV